MFKKEKVRDSVGFLIYQAERALHSELNRALTEAQIPLTIEQWPLLVHLIKNNGLLQHELACRAHKDKTTLARVIATMERNGLVKREEQTCDKRTKRIYITDKGSVLLPQVANLFENLGGRYLNGITPDEQIILKKGLFTIISNLLDSQRMDRIVDSLAYLEGGEAAWSKECREKRNTNK